MIEAVEHGEVTVLEALGALQYSQQCLLNYLNPIIRSIVTAHGFLEELSEKASEKKRH